MPAVHATVIPPLLHARLRVGFSHVPGISFTRENELGNFGVVSRFSPWGFAHEPGCHVQKQSPKGLSDGLEIWESRKHLYSICSVGLLAANNVPQTAMRTARIWVTLASPKNTLHLGGCCWGRMVFIKGTFPCKPTCHSDRCSELQANTAKLRGGKIKMELQGGKEPRTRYKYTHFPISLLILVLFMGPQMNEVHKTGYHGDECQLSPKSPRFTEMVQWTTDYKNERRRHTCRCRTAEICR